MTKMLVIWISIKKAQLPEGIEEQSGEGTLWSMLGEITCHKPGMPLHVLNLPAMQETQVQSLGWEDPLEEGKATHSSILAWRIPWTGEPGGLQSTGSQRVRHN